ncbi:SgcJ/EcaC family oxidoreductase [Dictyobacter formicarum]|uniref:DUF4440 domain-containing protein n=1 Tax=Dictyobacter formicarum TaxID=2778368 RepID=A0ABQ3VTS7_9CHLR|nr:SgcJ/EcaC family oxidoreductase [Dictyobacter formicarum]GHO89684.1 hypothetical protein KSZ_76900 [Dictyobacter formicarum]
MGLDAAQSQNISSSDEETVRALYRQILDGWNQHDAAAFAAPFAEDAEVIGFDGSLMFGRGEIEETLRQIFSNHVTAPYISKVKSVRLVRPGVAMLRAIVGMIPPGQKELNPAVNAHQVIVAAQHNGGWHVELLQNTPAQFHGRPELVQQMTDELTQKQSSGER